MTNPRTVPECLYVMKLRAPLAVLIFLLSAWAGHAAEEWGFDPRFRPLPGTDVLVRGDVPLLRRDVDAFVDLVEASFDLAMPRAVEGRLRVAIEEGFEKAGETDRRAFLQRVEGIESLRDLVRQQKVLEAEEGLMAFRRSLDAMLQRDPPDPVATLLRDLLRGRHEIVWAGDPPLNEAAVDAWLATAAFVAALARNDGVVLTEGKKAVTRRDLGVLFRARDADERKRVLQAHRTWIRIQTAWDDSSELRRLRLRKAAVDYVASILPEEKRVEVGQIDSLETYARSAAVLRDVVTAFDTLSTLASRPKEVLALLDTWLGPLPDGQDVLLLYRE